MSVKYLALKSQNNREERDFFSLFWNIIIVFSVAPNPSSLSGRDLRAEKLLFQLRSLLSAIPQSPVWLLALCLYPLVVLLEHFVDVMV